MPLTASMPTAIVPFKGYGTAVAHALDAVGAMDLISRQKTILVKPNLVNASPHPVTTPPECCEAVLRYIRCHSDADVVIAEGCGDPSFTTSDLFERHGYDRLAREWGVRLLDLNTAPLVKRSQPGCRRFTEMILPEILFSHWLISVPVLKAHSLSMITGTLKNMVGVVPPRHYAGREGIWNKASLHRDLHQAIVDLNRYRCPDLTVMDASVGLASFHLGGPECAPPVGRILAGTDPLHLDRRAAELLALDWRDIPHLRGEIDTDSGYFKA